MILPLSFRIIATISAIMIALMVYFIILNSKEKNEYQKISGRIVYLNKQFKQYPHRDLGKFRYLKLDTYPYIFEIYSNEQSFKVDSLKLKDTVSVYYYETNNTHSEQINRFLQYLEKDDKIFFKNDNRSKIVGIVVIILFIALLILSYFLYKKGKILF